MLKHLRKLDRAIMGLLLASFLLFLMSDPAYALEVDAKAAVLIEATTGRVLWQQNCHEKLPPASTTKIMTALLALEKGDMNGSVTVPADFVNAGESSIWVEPGETFQMKDLFYAMLLKSANDAAQMVAIGIAGSEENFVQMMNDKVTELGLKDTYFVNAYGLHDDDHYTSAYDLAMIARQAMQYDFFKEVITTKSYTLPWANNDYDRVVINANHFLKSYDYANGIKTGYTKQAGSCLVGAAEKDGMQLITVVLNCPQMYIDSKTIMEYGFANYTMKDIYTQNEEVGSVPVTGGKQDSVTAITKTALRYPVKSGESVPQAKLELVSKAKALVSAGDALGQVVLDDGNGVALSVPVVAADTVYPYNFIMLCKQIFQRIMTYWFVS